MTRINAHGVVFALVLVGCGGAAPNNNSNNNGSCSGTVSGSVSATITDCLITWVEGSDSSALIGSESHIDSSADDTNVFSALGITFVASGAAAAGTLNENNTVAASASLILPTGGGYASAHDTRAPGAPMFGTTSITITSFEQPDDGIPRWILHGTASASMETPPGVTSYSGSAMLQLSF